MNIKILQLIEGARKARGLTVIIDVFRAFSVDCYIFENGARMIIPIEDIENAYMLKRKHPNYILLGERGGKKPEGFDYGNSPTQIEDVDFSDRVIIHTTTAGTKGLVNATKAEEIITCSFVNAQTVVNYIELKKPDRVSLVCMGDAGIHSTDEDTLCARYIRDCLQNKPIDFQKIVDHLRSYETAQKFFDPEKSWAPERDFELCLSLNKFPFIIKAESFKDDLMCLKRIGNKRK
ncbi:2-phosphosulfolactate phosphatase [candidate division WOR-3 bacterium]|nr:2-phosphosulfolactate phosphatase [candidate division WOR-3 bacterium]MCK4576529.1 2-phosphosulfolactate phosphatase [candidate division WOR-3 bacterium]